MSEAIVDAEIVSKDNTPEHSQSDCNQLSQLDRVEIKLDMVNQKLDWAHNAVIQFGGNVDKNPMVKTLMGGLFKGLN